jgi:putative DNA primase/helicase
MTAALASRAASPPPTRADAEAALDFLDTLVDGFEFDAPLDRSVALSSLMTAVVRPRLRTAPMVVVTASRLVDVAAALAAGKPRPAVVGVGSSAIETDVRIRSALTARPEVLLVDGSASPAPFGGPSLAAALMNPDLVVRVPGTTRAAPVRTTMFGIGFGVRLREDVHRMVLSCRAADPGFDPVPRVIANRGFYVDAIETLIAAYAAAGDRPALDPLATFADWAEAVRGPLVWLGLSDPAASIGVLPRFLTGR